LGTIPNANVLNIADSDCHRGFLGIMYYML